MSEEEKNSIVKTKEEKELDDKDEHLRKPEAQLGVFWAICKPFLFGTVGA